MFDIILGILILASSLLTIFAANSIYGALQLIVTYCLVGVLLLVYDIEFFAITYIIVCAGGMGVLFLFVVMTLSTIQTQRKNFSFNKWNLLLLTGQFFLFLVPMICFFIFQLQVLSEFDLFYIFESRLSNYTYHETFGTNIIELGSYLYLEYPVIVILSGVILFFALIAAVFLTIDHAKPPVWNRWFGKIFNF